MYVDYFFYLWKLAQEERTKQILIIILIWAIMLLIAGIVEFIKYKSNKE